MAEIKKYLDTVALGALVDQIKAEDAKVKAYVDKHIEDAGKTYDAAGSAATAESNAKAYTDELANGQVKTNKEAIATLNGDASTAGSVAKAVADAKVLIDADIDAVEKKADDNTAAITAINDGTNGILAQAKGYTDAEVAKVQGEVDALETYVGTIPEGATATNVIAYVQEKTSGIATEGAMTELGNRVTQAEKDIDAIEADYLKNEHKIALEGQISGVQTAVDTEKSRAEGIEAGLRTDINTVMGDYLKAADKTELQGNIDTLAGVVETLSEGVDPDKVDGVKDLIAYVDEHGATVTGLQDGIDANAEAIEGVAGRMTTAEGKITAVEGAVATKAEKTYVDEKVEALTGADTALSGRIATLEGKFGGAEGSVEDQIADAQAAAIAAAAADATSKDTALETLLKKYADDEDAKIEATIATLTETVNGKAAQSEVNTISGKVTTLEGDMTQAKLDIDAVEVKAGANETAIAGLQTAVGGKVAQGDFDNAVARIAQNETDIAALEEASATHALASDLTDAIERIAANETAIAANASAINSFTAITADEVNALFA